MRYTLSLTDVQYESLTSHLFSTKTEMAAFMLCRFSHTSSETRLLVREIIPVEAADVISASGHHMEIRSQAYIRGMKKAHLGKQGFVFIHSHPPHYPEHSPQDDAEERKLFQTAHIRIDGAPVHASLVLSSPHLPVGRVWFADGHTEPIERIRVIGKRFRFYFSPVEGQERVSPIFDRQVRAFGEDFQRIVRKLHIAVVGNGGTGSAVIEQAIRLGAGEISVFDQQCLANTNVTRVYGSRLVDVDLPKAKLMERMAADIGLGTVVHTYIGNVTSRANAERLRECDVVFCCTDDQWGRSILTRLALYYYIPVIDMGVKVDSENGLIHSVQGRVTVLLPGAACLFCRSRITPEGVAAESKQAANPAEAEELRRQKYIPELEDAAPAVIPFTTTVAASALIEFAHRLTGFMGEDRTSTEILHLIDSGKVASNSRPPDPECNLCGSTSVWGRGDVTPFMDMTWPD
jgi:molybdopterin/thiamine biosynthesis adenylyltransferase